MLSFLLGYASVLTPSKAWFRVSNSLKFEVFRISAPAPAGAGGRAGWLTALPDPLAALMLVTLATFWPEAKRLFAMSAFRVYSSEIFNYTAKSMNCVNLTLDTQIIYCKSSFKILPNNHGRRINGKYHPCQCIRIRKHFPSFLCKKDFLSFICYTSFSFHAPFLALFVIRIFS